jgi:hypothetical protein
VTLRVWHEEDENGKPLRVNERIPKSKMVFNIMSNKERDCLILTKLNPFEEWGLLRWEFNIGGKVTDVQPIIIPAPIVPTVEVPLPKEEPINPNVKTCPICTFDNDKSLFYCEVCGNALPA